MVVVVGKVLDMGWRDSTAAVDTEEDMGCIHMVGRGGNHFLEAVAL